MNIDESNDNARFQMSEDAYLKAAFRRMKRDKAAMVGTVIIGALGYFIFPLDAIPDFIPAVGLTDDLGVFAAAVTTLELNIPQNARDKADAKLKEWFGA